MTPEYWLRSQECRESSAVDTCSNNPSSCVRVFGEDCTNYHDYPSVWICGSGEYENREQKVCTSFNVFMLPMSAWCVFTPKAKLSTFSPIMNLNLSRLLSLTLHNIINGVYGCRWCFTSQCHRMWVDLDGTLSHLPGYS